MKGFIALLGALLLAPTTLLAENSTHVDGYTIHHNVLTTEFLDPAVARNYQITRSTNRGMINIAIIKDMPGSTGQPVAGKVQAKATNLLGQSREIALREIREGEAIYYIGDFLVQGNEVLNFDMQVQPERDNHTYSARLSHQFFSQ